MKTSNALRGLLSGLLLLAAGNSAAHAQLVTPPGLVNGQQFRLVFVTSGSGNAASTNIATYDDFVSNAASVAGLTTYSGNAVTWRVLGYSTSVSVFTRVAANAPESIYRLDGVKVADNGVDLWDGSIDNPISISELGTSVNAHVWTGFISDGSSPTNGSRIWRLGSGSGNGTVLFGISSATDTSWAALNAESKGILNRYYAVSSVLTAVVNAAPTANAGIDQSIRAGANVLLDGSASFDDNTASTELDYAWSFESKPEGSTAVIDNANTATPSFIADVAGSYVVELVVTDELGAASQPDSVIISSDNQAPTAVATVDFGIAIVGDTSSFDGTDSTDPENDQLTYAWTLTAAPTGSTSVIVGANTATPSLTTDLEGTYELTLNVSDFIGAGTPATVEIVATTPAGYAELQIVYSSDLVEALPAGQVTTAGNQNALGNFLKSATKNIQQGNLDKAITDLKQAIERTDGFPLRGTADSNGPGRDWITDPVAQAEAYALLNAALAALQP